MAEKTKTVYHPTFSDVTHEVAEKDAGQWKDAGWRFTPIADDKTETTTAKAEPSKG